MGLSVDIDISVITENVIDAVYAGYEFHGNSSLGVADEASGFPSKGLRRGGINDSDTVPDQPALKKERLAIIMGHWLEIKLDLQYTIRGSEKSLDESLW